MITAVVVADSMAYGTRITTVDVLYPEEYDHALMECRMMSRTAMPVKDGEGLKRLLITMTEWEHWIEVHSNDILKPISDAIAASEAKEFEADDWHVPYYHEGFWQDTGNGLDLLGNTVEQARVISAVTIKHGDEEGILAVGQKHLYDEMKERGGKCYFEHQASPMGLRAVNMTEDFDIIFDEGVTHFDRKGKAWSANFHDWLQLRQMGSFQEEPKDDG